MPTDNQGKFRLNNQQVRRANAAGAPGEAPAAPAPVEEVVTEAAPFATIFDNGDGTGYTEMADGARVDLPDFAAATAGLMGSGDPAMMDGAMSPAQDTGDPGDWA